MSNFTFFSIFIGSIVVFKSLVSDPEVYSNCRDISQINAWKKWTKHVFLSCVWLA